MTHQNSFDLKNFMPYLLNQAADATSQGFAAYYKSEYGMLRTEWRVIFHLGHYGKMTAKEICTRSQIHKTKVSRAVRALEVKRYLERHQNEDDRRHETLTLTRTGERVFSDLVREAQRFDAKLMADFSADEQAQMRRLLTKLAQL